MALGTQVTWSTLCRGAWWLLEVLGLTWAPWGGRPVPAAPEVSQAQAVGG